MIASSSLLSPPISADAFSADQSVVYGSIAAAVILTALCAANRLNRETPHIYHDGRKYLHIDRSKFHLVMEYGGGEPREASTKFKKEMRAAIQAWQLLRFRGDQNRYYIPFLETVNKPIIHHSQMPGWAIDTWSCSTAQSYRISIRPSHSTISEDHDPGHNAIDLAFTGWERRFDL